MNKIDIRGCENARILVDLLMNTSTRASSRYRLLKKKGKKEIQTAEVEHETLQCDQLLQPTRLLRHVTYMFKFTFLQDYRLRGKTTHYQIIYGMLNYLQASPEAKARLLMQKEKRKRDSASERGIEKRQKTHLASIRAMLSYKNKSDELQVKEVLDDIICLVMHCQGLQQEGSGRKEYCKDFRQGRAGYLQSQ